MSGSMYQREEKVSVWSGTVLERNFQFGQQDNLFWYSIVEFYCTYRYIFFLQYIKSRKMESTLFFKTSNIM